jgi:hypothetical protein
VELVRSASTLGRLLLNRLLLDRVFFFFTTVFFFAAGRFATTRFFAAPPSTMLFTYAYFTYHEIDPILSILGGLASDCTSRKLRLVTRCVLDSW